jgi:hypothetical protein
VTSTHGKTPPPETEPTEKVDGEYPTKNTAKRPGDGASHEEEPPKKKFHLEDIVPTKDVGKWSLPERTFARIPRGV